LSVDGLIGFSFSQDFWGGHFKKLEIFLCRDAKGRRDAYFLQNSRG
jgi:hypothetical protein